MWLVINREYVEDPVYLSLVPAPVFHARRLSMLVFFDRGEGQPLEILTVSRYPMARLRRRLERRHRGEPVEAAGRRSSRERKPQAIGINTSRHVVVRRRPDRRPARRPHGRAGPGPGGAHRQRREPVRPLARDAHAAGDWTSTRTWSPSRAAWSPRHSPSASSRQASRRPTTWSGTSASGSPTSACRPGFCPTWIARPPARTCTASRRSAATAA